MITRILYYTLVLPISLFPEKLLYLISDIIYIILYKIFKYRKQVVLTNLKNAFPKKSKKELLKIMDGFYHHLCDIIIETIKGFTISEGYLRRHFVIKNTELSSSFTDMGQNVIFVGGHYNNWELCGQAFGLYSKHKCIAIYKPLSNKFLNNTIYASRSKHGTDLVSMKQAKKSFEESNEAQAIAFVSDQNPSNPKNAYWVNFLNQETAVLFGAEKYAKEYNCAVIYVSISKEKRGHYEAKYSLITDQPNNQPYGKITEDFTKKLEKDIINQPQYWLWSHKRWKHKR